jgi:hypothetical protein
VGLLGKYVATRLAIAHRDQAQRHRAKRNAHRARIRAADERTMQALLSIRRPSVQAMALAERARDVLEAATFTIPVSRLAPGDYLREVEGVLLEAEVRDVYEVSPGVWRVDLNRKPYRLALDGSTPCVIWREEME